MTKEETVSTEWVMVSTGDPMNYYLGHPFWTASDLERLGGYKPEVVATLPGLKDYLDTCLARGEPIKLKETRVFLTMMHPMPNGGVGMASQLFPISAAGMAIEVRVRATSIVYPADVPGMTEQMSKMVEMVRGKELDARARAVGIVPATRMPDGRGHQ